MKPTTIKRAGIATMAFGAAITTYGLYSIASYEFPKTPTLEKITLTDNAIRFQERNYRTIKSAIDPASVEPTQYTNPWDKLSVSALATIEELKRDKETLEHTPEYKKERALQAAASRDFGDKTNPPMQIGLFSLLAGYIVKKIGDRKIRKEEMARYDAMFKQRFEEYDRARSELEGKLGARDMQ